MGDPSPQDLPAAPVPPGKPPFAPPPGTPYYGPPHDAEWAPPPGSVFGGGPDVLEASARGRRGRQAWPANARPVSTNGPDAGKDKGSRAVVLLLAAAALVAALITGRASLLGSDATSAWQSSVSAEQKRGALLLEDASYTYTVEGDLAFMIATAQIRAQELRAAAEGKAPEVAARLVAEAQVQQQVVDLISTSSEVVSNARYVLPDGGYDLQLRLADRRRELGEDLTIDPVAVVAAGDAAAERATQLMATNLLIGMAFLLGALAQALLPWRRMLLVLGWASLSVAATIAIVLEAGR